MIHKFATRRRFKRFAMRKVDKLKRERELHAKLLDDGRFHPACREFFYWAHLESAIKVSKSEKGA